MISNVSITKMILCSNPVYQLYPLYNYPPCDLTFNSLRFTPVKWSCIRVPLYLPPSQIAPPPPRGRAQGTLPSHWGTLGWGGYNIYMFLVWISKPITSHIKEEVTFLLIFYYHISAFLHCCHSLKPSLCHCYHFGCLMLLFHLEFYRNIASSVYQSFQYHRFLTTQVTGIECHTFV